MFKTKSTLPPIVALIIAALAFCLAGCSSADKQGQDDQPAMVSVTVKADGWTAESSPVVAVIAQDDTDKTWSTAFSANEEQQWALSDGSYYVRLVSPINPDGSIYLIHAFQVYVSDGKADPVETEIEHVPADQVTSDTLEKIVADLGEAAKCGDDTMSGDAGKKVIEKASGNAANNPNADKSELQQATEAASESVAASPVESAGTASSSGTASPVASGDGGSSSAPAASSSGTGSSAPAATDGGSSSEPAPAPVHTHSWVEQTSQVYVVDTPAQVVQVGSQYVCSQCGAAFGDESGLVAHMEASNRACRSWSVQPVYQTVPESGHYETVVTGYVCSGCGAVK